MQQPIALRIATADDADQIGELVRSAYGKWVPVIGREPLPMRVDYAEALRLHRIDLLLCEGALAGLIETLQHPDHLWIENVAVHPDWQGRGFGRLLLARAEERVASANSVELRLLTNAAFASNLALYRKIGYRIDRSEPFSLGGTTVYLSKSLR